jgi:hypothetical protein
MDDEKAKDTAILITVGCLAILLPMMCLCFTTLFGILFLNITMS